MTASIFLGNLNFKATPDDVRAMLTQLGFAASEVRLPRDEDDRVRGFAFATLTDPSATDAAIDALDGYEFMGRALRASVASPKRR